MGRAFFHVFLLLAVLLGAAAAQAMDFNGLRRLVNAYMDGQLPALAQRYGKNSRIRFSLQAMDPRLSLPDCPQKPTLALREQPILTSRVNVQVSCDAGMGWSVYVPVDLAVYRKVVSASHPLPRHTVIAAADLQLIDTDITQLNGQYLTRPDQAIGLSVQRQINPGTPLSSRDLAEPILVHRGQAVTIVARTGGLSVKMPGIALADGRRGEQIQIRNSNTSRVVTAAVVDAEHVEVPM